MAKFAIQTVDGKYLKLTPADVDYNAQHMAQHGTLRIGAEVNSKPYNYKTREAADAALATINAYIKQNNTTPAQRAQCPGEWRYYKYIDRQIGCTVVEL